MAERTLSGACKKFSANVFDKNKCQNCFKTKEVHQEETSPTSPRRPLSLDVSNTRTKITVKTGILSLATQVSTLPEVRVQQWEKVCFVLYSSGVLDWFAGESAKPGQTPLGDISLDDCIGLTNAEVDTNEAFSIGIKTTSKVHYLKAENRLEMDNWCRVLKPFVIASPGYNFNRKTPYSHSFSQQEAKFNSARNTTKATVSRTVSGPAWSVTPDSKTSPGNGTQSSKKRSPSLVKEEIICEDPKKTRRKSPELESRDVEQIIDDSPLAATPQPQPYYTDKYLRPISPVVQVNGVESEEISEIKLQLVEAQQSVKHSEDKAEICSKTLTETKKRLQKANNVISIQKANIESLEVEIETVRANVRENDEQLENRLKELECGVRNGSAKPETIESGFIELQSKLQENENSLIRRTRELEKANESRAKVAKHTRALLVELETKLKGNNQRICELEEQLLVRTLELNYEKEEKQRVQNEREHGGSKEHAKQREITKKSTQLLQQAKEDHLKSKNVRKNEVKLQEEIQRYQNELQDKNTELKKLRGELTEVENLRGQVAEVGKLRGQVAEVKKLRGQVAEVEKLRGQVAEVEKLRGQLFEREKKDGEIRELETAYKKASEKLTKYEMELGEVKTDVVKEKTKGSELENRLQGVSVELKEKDKELNEIRMEKAKLKHEMEKVKEKHNHQLLLLQEDNETTRNRLQEVGNELRSLLADDVNVDDVDGLRNEVELSKTKLEMNKKEVKKLQEIQVQTLQNFNNEKNKRLQLERDVETVQNELERMKTTQEEVLIVKKELDETKEKLHSVRIEVKQLEELRRNTDAMNKKNENEKAAIVNELGIKVKQSKKELCELRKTLCESEEKVLSLSQELHSRLKMEEEALGWVEGVERNLTETQTNLIASRESILSKAEQLDAEKSCIVKAVKQLGDYVKILETSLTVEKSKVEDLETQVQNQASFSNCPSCDENVVKNARERELFAQELEAARHLHRTELETLKESMVTDAQVLKCQAEEIRLKLTSKVILLQSDISELTAKHSQETVFADGVFKQELKKLRNEGDSLKANDEISSLRERIKEQEEELKEDREGNERKINLLKSEYEKKIINDGKKNGVVNPAEREEVQQQHSKAIETLKENHQKELEENKADMMMVLQALKSDSYTSSTMSGDSMDATNSEQLHKLERYVETMQKEHKKELERLNEEHEQGLQELRSDMVTLLRAQETYKTPVPGEEQTFPSGSNAVHLERQLERIRQSHEQEIREKDAKHREEVEQLQSDMLVAIQAATASVPGLPRSLGSDQSDGQVHQLQDQITQIQELFEKERDVLHNTIKKAESATKFGLRRNEEMSNKIYQMQREMEEIDAKYQKEIKMYKEAFDQEKIRKTTIGAVPGILVENESLKVTLQELELSMEQMQVRYDGEIKRYKEKFQQETVLTVEELQLKIKSHEDSIEQMRLEHENELQRYTKAVKRGKVSLAGTAKERDLERKVDDLESKVDMMRQKHREEVRKYRERLEDEMERHRKEVSDSRSKLRKLEMDNRQMEDLKNKVTELENKTSKLNKDSTKTKEQEAELTETKGKNRELQRQVDSLKRKVEKYEEAGEENKDPSSSTESLPRNKLSRYSSCDNMSLNSRNKTQGNESSSQEDVFEPNNNSIKSEIGGYKLNQGLQRPASVSAFPVQTENVTRRTNYNEHTKKDPLMKRPNSGSTTNKAFPSASRLLKTSTSATNLK